MERGWRRSGGAHIPVSGTGQAPVFPRQREREKMDSRFHGNDEKGGGNDEKGGGNDEKRGGNDEKKGGNDGG